MAKCRQCNRKGLFFKVDNNGYCKDCAFELDYKKRISDLDYDYNKAKANLDNINVQLNDASILLSAAMDKAKTEAYRLLESEEIRLKSECEKLNRTAQAISARCDELAEKRDSTQKSLNTALRRIEKVKPISNSIKHAFDLWVNGDHEHAAAIISNLEIEDILPEPELNCLTVKQLKSRYTMLRKQIVELCAAYESKYTNKTNSALYKLMVLALESELENILYKLQFGKLETGTKAVQELTAKYYAIGAEGNQTIAPTLKRFIGQIESLYLEVVETEYEYYVQRERAREEQRAIKEQMRQEAEERKRLEQERKKVEAEESKYQTEIARITSQMQQAHDAELEALQKRLDEMNALMNKVAEKKTEIINLQNGKAGTVYIISNIGSFGDHVFKIGMTRRLEPQDRVNELGDASVPFPFDVHSFIFSEDAVSLENALHKELNDRRVNKVNLRKEFFDITIEELQALVERIDPTAPFRVTALAEQYRQSLSITSVPDEVHIDVDDE